MKFIIFEIFLYIALSVQDKNNTSPVSNATTKNIPLSQLSTLQELTKLAKSNAEDSEKQSQLDICNDNKFLDLEIWYENASPNYPKPYPVGETKKQRIFQKDEMGIDIIICDLDIDPEKDFLQLSSITEDDVIKDSRILTGKSEPIRFRVLQTNKMDIEFGAWTENKHKHKGYRLLYSFYKGEPKSTPKPPSTSIPFDALESHSIILILPAANQSEQSWYKFKELLCNATNQFIIHENLELEPCKTENDITIKSVIKCPELWPKSTDCIEFTFGISLYTLEDDEIKFNPILKESRKPEILSKIQLKNIWQNYGKTLFSHAGYYEYTTPDVTRIILLWLGIGIGIVLFAIILLIAICKFSAFRDYWPTADDDNQDILRKSSDMDVSMFPSPDQVVPPLFPIGVSGYTSSETHGNIRYRDTTESRFNESVALKERTGNGALNFGYVDDEDHVNKRMAANYQTYVRGVNTDEATS